MAKRIVVTQESSTGRNVAFLDTKTGNKMTRSGFVKEINTGNYNNYHVRVINGLATPVSNPNGSTKDNLD